MNFDEFYQDIYFLPFHEILIAVRSCLTVFESKTRYCQNDSKQVILTLFVTVIRGQYSWAAILEIVKI